MEQCTIKEYKEKYMEDKCTKTIWLYCRDGLLPINHVPVRKGNIYLINIIDPAPENKEDLTPYLLAIKEYIRVKKVGCDLALCTEIGIRHNIERQRFLNEILGYKQL